MKSEERSEFVGKIFGKRCQIFKIQPLTNSRGMGVGRGDQMHTLQRIIFPVDPGRFAAHFKIAQQN